MSYLVLARKYRPQTFDEVVGQIHVTQTLTNAIAMGRVPHAVLFSGPRGTGKTTIARILAKAMNCEQGPTKTPCNICRSCMEITRGNAVDVFEIDGASNNGVEQVRELRENIKYMPSHSRYKIYIIDEVHMLSIAAFNALLKTLEEPPSHIMFLFATTEPHKIPLTILSRCQRHDFRRIDIESISHHLGDLCQREGFGMDTESLTTIAREGGGSMRDALSLLDQVISCFEGAMTHDQLVDALGVIDKKQLFDISEAVFKRDVPEIIEILDRIYDRGHDVKKLFSDILVHFRNMTVIKMAKQADKVVDLPKHEIEEMRQQIETVPITFLNQILDFLMNAESSIRYSDQPKLSLELIFIKLLQIKPALPIDVLIQKINQLAANCHVPNAPQPEKTALPENIGEARTPVLRVPLQARGPLNSGAGNVDHGSPIPYDYVKTWDLLLDRIRAESGAVAANLTDSGISSITGDTIEIEVNGNEFNLSMVNREKSLAILQKICDAFFGKKMKLTIHAKKKQNSLKEKNNTEKNLKQEALNHPLVADALTIFNGHIVDVKIVNDP